MPKALWHCFHFLLTPQLRFFVTWVPRGWNHTDLNRNLLFAWACKQICVRFVLEASLLNFKCGSSSTMKDSHDPIKTNDICSGKPLGFKGRIDQKAYNRDDNFRWVALKYVPALASALSLAHPLSLAKKIGSWAELLLIGSDDCTRFLRLAGDPWSLAKEMKSRRRPSNSAKSCIFEGKTAIDRQRIKAESQGTAAQRSNLSIRDQILPAVDWMRWAKMITGDNSGDSSSFAAKLSPWCKGGDKPWKTSSQEHQATGREWRLWFLNRDKHVKRISCWHLQ